MTSDKLQDFIINVVFWAVIGVVSFATYSILTIHTTDSECLSSNQITLTVEK